MINIFKTIENLKKEIKELKELNNALEEKQKQKEWEKIPNYPVIYTCVKCKKESFNAKLFKRFKKENEQFVALLGTYHLFDVCLDCLKKLGYEK